MNRSGLYFCLIAVVAALCSCSTDKRKMVVNTWRLAEDSTVVFDIKADSTFTSREGNVTLNGKWSISDDGQWLSIKMDGKEGETKSQVKTLEHEKLILSTTGEELVFVGAE